MMSVQISAYIQDDIKEKMERYSSSHGLKKGFLIENAIEYYLQALHEIPTSVLVPGSISIDEKTDEKIEQLNLKKPNKKLIELLS